MELPKPFIEKYSKLLGDEAPAFLAAIATGTPQKAFRVNSLKPAYRQMLTQFGPEELIPAPFGEESYLGTVGGHSLLHQAGYVYSQEPSAMIVAAIAQAQPGEKVLDLCAAPGGKSTQLAAQMQNQGLLVANEIFSKRAKILSENLERWGATNCLVTNHAPAELVPKFSGFFDRIVVDAPCSGEGMFRKDPVAVAEWQADTPAKCAARQKEILTAAVAMLAPEGELIYSTCTFAPEENEAIISWLVTNFPLTIMPLAIEGTANGRPEWGSVPGLEGTVRLWPQQGQGEGHFAAKLRFHGANPKPKVATKTKKTKNKKAEKTTLSKELEPLWQAFTKEFPLPNQTGRAERFGDYIWWVPESAPDLGGIRVLRSGVQMAQVKKNRLEPAFNLAMTAPAVAASQRLAITLADWQKYVAGATFTASGNAGWVLLTVAEIPVGFGKQVQGVVKNFYPKGLRFVVDPLK